MPASATIAATDITSSAISFSAGTTISSANVNSNFSNLHSGTEIFRGHIIPVDASSSAAANNSYDLGSTDYVWRKTYTHAFGDVQSTNSTYTIATTDSLVLYTGTATATFTLPTAVSYTGNIISVKKTADTFTALTIDGNGSETIDQTTAATLTTLDDSITIISDGSNWKTLSKNITHRSQVRLHTSNGYGSTSNKIRRFSTTIQNVGNDITYYR